MFKNKNTNLLQMSGILNKHLNKRHDRKTFVEKVENTRKFSRKVFYISQALCL